MSERLIIPKFSPDSFSRKCLPFFENDPEWLNRQAGSESDFMQRSVTWGQYPYRYWLEQSAVESRNLLHRPILRHRMFSVALMSATRTIDGLREFERWHIIQKKKQPEQIYYLTNVVEEPERENKTGELEKNNNFVLNHDLFEPNSEDMLRLDMILDLGRQDGYEPLSAHSSN